MQKIKQRFRFKLSFAVLFLEAILLLSQSGVLGSPAQPNSLPSSLSRVPLRLGNQDQPDNQNDANPEAPTIANPSNNLPEKYRDLLSALNTNHREPLSSASWWRHQFNRQRRTFADLVEAAGATPKPETVVGELSKVNETDSRDPTRQAAQAEMALQQQLGFEFFVVNAATRLEKQHEQLFQAWKHIQDRIEGRLEDLSFLTLSMLSTVNLSREKLNKVVSILNVTTSSGDGWHGTPQPEQQQQRRATALVDSTELPVQSGWGRFLPEVATSESDSQESSQQQSACAEKQELEYYSKKLLHTIDRLAANVSTVLNKSTVNNANPAESTLLTEAAMKRMIDEAKEHLTSLMHQFESKALGSLMHASSTGELLQAPVSRDCAERQWQLQEQFGTNWTHEMARNHSGVHQIWPDRSPAPFMVYCDFESGPTVGGWTVIQSRNDGTTSFYRNWAEYRAGFGNINGDHWLGLEHIYHLTNQAVYELRVELENFEHQRAHASYPAFAIGPETERYQLKVLAPFGGGDAGDAMAYHAGMKFSTFDSDNDLWAADSCARAHMGGWWYNHCESANLNGLYLNGYEGAGTSYKGMFWSEWMGPDYSLKRVTLKVRPVDGWQHLRSVQSVAGSTPPGSSVDLVSADGAESEIELLKVRDRKSDSVGQKEVAYPIPDF